MVKPCLVFCFIDMTGLNYSRQKQKTLSWVFFLIGYIACFYYLVRVLGDWLPKFTNFTATLFATMWFFFPLGGESVQGHLTKSSFLLITHRSNLKLFVLYWQIWLVEFCASSLQSQDSLQSFLSSLSKPLSSHKLFINKEEDQREAGRQAAKPICVYGYRVFCLFALICYAPATLRKLLCPSALSVSVSRRLQFPFISNPAIMER